MSCIDDDDDDDDDGEDEETITTAAAACAMKPFFAEDLVLDEEVGRDDASNEQDHNNMKTWG